MTTPTSTSEPNRLLEEPGESELARAGAPAGGFVVPHLAEYAREGAGGAGPRRRFHHAPHRDRGRGVVRGES